MNVKRITRLVALLRRLQADNGDNAEGLAAACGVSRRTVFRDIEALREAGVPVEFAERAQRYRIDSAHFLPPTDLTLDEALSIVLLAAGAEGPERDAVLSSAVDAAHKIRSRLPESMRERLDEAAGAIVVRPTPRNPLSDKKDTYHTLLAASVDRRTVRVRYDCLTEFKEIETDFDPYHLMHHHRSWYAIGKSSRHKSVRTLNIGRVLRFEVLDRRFRRPKSFSVREHLGNAWRMIPESGPDTAVHLRFSSLVGQNVSEVLWHRTQRCERRDDGSLDYYVTVSGLREIVWWILGYGDHVEVVSPERLRREVARRLRAAADRYADA